MLSYAGPHGLNMASQWLWRLWGRSHNFRVAIGQEARQEAHLVSYGVAIGQEARQEGRR